MTLKSHAKFGEKLTCGLGNDMRNLANFHQNTWKCQNWYFHGILLSKVEHTWAKNSQLCVMTLKNDEKYEEELTWRFKIEMEFDEFWLEHWEVSKIYTLMGWFWQKYIMFDLKSTEELYFTTLKSDAKMTVK